MPRVSECGAARTETPVRARLGAHTCSYGSKSCPAHVPTFVRNREKDYIQRGSTYVRTGISTRVHVHRYTCALTRERAPLLGHTCSYVRARAYEMYGELFRSSARTNLHVHMYTYVCLPCTYVWARTCEHVRTYVHTHPSVCVRVRTYRHVISREPHTRRSQT
jgi:hypothetical protein